MREGDGGIEVTSGWLMCNRIVHTYWDCRVREKIMPLTRILIKRREFRGKDCKFRFEHGACEEPTGSILWI